jgi:ABC-2 type transport system permease protein
MQTIFNLALKDLNLMRRDKAGLFWIFIFPLIFALFFGAINNNRGSSNAGGLKVIVVDLDQSPESTALLSRLKKNEALTVSEKPRADAEAEVRRGDAQAFLVIPESFGKHGFFSRSAPPAELGMDPSRKAEGGYLEGMLHEAIYAGLADRFTDPKKTVADARRAREELSKSTDANQKILWLGFLADLEKHFDKIDPKLLATDDSAGAMMKQPIKRVDVAEDKSGRPLSAYEVTFPSAILWGLYGCVMSFAISIVSEKTQGTLLRLRTTPLTWGHILAGKGLGCFLACLAVATALLVVGKLFFGVRVLQPVGLLVAIPLAAFAFTGLMMFVATLGSSERAVAGAASGIFMPLAMLGGGMIPLFFMPTWLQQAASISPFKWGILALEGAIWRGYEVTDYLLPCLVLIAFGAAGFTLGVMMLTRRSAI